MLKDKKLEYRVIGGIENSDICLVFIHGWGGDKDSFERVAESFNIKNSVWFMPQGPYPLDKKDSYSWTYEISPGKFERDEPIKMLIDFFNNQIFSKFNSRDVYLFGFSQGGLVCYEMIKLLDKPLGGVFPIGGFMSGVKKDINRIPEIDILLEDDKHNACYIEVKNVSFGNSNGEGFFPDAVTTRGQKHLRELILLKKSGIQAVLFFCVQHSGLNSVAPAEEIDPVYGDLLKQAHGLGVEVLAYRFKVDIDSSRIELERAVAVKV